MFARGDGIFVKIMAVASSLLQQGLLPGNGPYDVAVGMQGCAQCG